MNGFYCAIFQNRLTVRMEWKLFYPASLPKQTQRIPKTWMCAPLKTGSSYSSALKLGFGLTIF